MGVSDERGRLYDGPAHRWAAPIGGRPLSVFLFGVAATVVVAELVLAVGELVAYGFVLPPTARAFAAAGLALLVAGNAKTLVLPLRGRASEPLEGLVDVALDRLWLAHFWLNPLGLFSLGLFLLFAPRAQPPFYYMAYGVLLWQAVGGLLAREAVPLGPRTGPTGRAARAAHHQPAVFVLLAVLVAGGFVDSLFP